MPATIRCHGARSGLTLTASLYPDADATADAEGLDVDEADDGAYEFENDTLTGLHLIRLFSGSVPRYFGWVFLRTSGTMTAEDSRELALLASGAAAGGTGINEIIVHVIDQDGNDLPNAHVTVLQSALPVAEGTTDEDGLITDPGLMLPTATATKFRASLGGYSSEQVIQDVAGDGTVEITLTQYVPPVSDDGFVTGHLICYGSDRQPLAGVVHYLKLVVPGSGTGSSDSENQGSVTSISAGHVSFVNLRPGATYLIQRGDQSEDTIAYRFEAESEDFEIRRIRDGQPLK